MVCVQFSTHFATWRTMSFLYSGAKHLLNMVICGVCVTLGVLFPTFIQKPFTHEPYLHRSRAPHPPSPPQLPYSLGSTFILQRSFTFIIFPLLQVSKEVECRLNSSQYKCVYAELFVQPRWVTLKLNRTTHITFYLDIFTDCR